jgi:3-hydroxyisobutyrate dehydrogenase
VPGPGADLAGQRDYKPGFAAALMLKDLKLSQAAATDAGAMTPLGATAAALYQRFADEGFGGKDFSAIINMLREETETR